MQYGDSRRIYAELASEGEERRSQNQAEVHSNASAYLQRNTAIEQQDAIIAAATSRLPWTCLGDSDGETLRTVIRETPAFHIEREISLKLESQDRPITLNDMRDMRTLPSYPTSYCYGRKPIH